MEKIKVYGSFPEINNRKIGKIIARAKENFLLNNTSAIIVIPAVGTSTPNII
jgi:hypothetical protein